MKRSKIAGIGSYLPERIITNDELAQVMDFYKVCFTLSDINDAFNVGKNYNDTTVMDKSFQSILNVKIHNVEVDWQCTHCNGRNTHKMSCKLPTREERIVLVNNSVMVQKLL